MLRLLKSAEHDLFHLDLQLTSKLPRKWRGWVNAEAWFDSWCGTLYFNLFQRTRSMKRLLLLDTGSGQGFYADQHIQVLLTTMAKKSYGRVLAKPKILVNDNEKGTIDTTKTIYIARHDRLHHCRLGHGSHKYELHFRPISIRYQA